MLYRTLLKLKERNGLTDDLKTKIDIFFLDKLLHIVESRRNSTMS